MPRTLSSNNQNGVAAAITRPVYLVEIGFSTPMRLSTRDSITFDGDLFTAASLNITINPPTASIRLFNADNSYSPIFAAEGSGKPLTIYELYGEGPFNAADADVYFTGETGAATIEDFITLTALEREVRMPKIMATDQIFSRLPADGTEIQTRSGIFVLKRKF